MGVAATEAGLVLSTLPGRAGAPADAPGGGAGPRSVAAPPRVERLLDAAEEALTAYYAFWPDHPGERITALWEALLDLPVDLEGLTSFTRRVLEGLREVPPGAVVSYGALAARVGSPRAARAVGAVMARNPLPVILPCHRVISKDGTLGGFCGGRGEDALALKRRLLAYEGWRNEPAGASGRSRRSSGAHS
jgi:methylated-DNA-[protein]-cysteine S-methyltransferase